MAESRCGREDEMSLEAYERLVLLAGGRRRGQPCDELEDWLRADPATAEVVEILDQVGRELNAQLEGTAPSAAHVASQRASLLARIEARRRGRRLRRAACLVAIACLVLVIILLWLASGCRRGGRSASVSCRSWARCGGEISGADVSGVAHGSDEFTMRSY